MDPARCPCFLENIVDVGSNGGEGNVHLIGNLLITEAEADKFNNLGFTLCYFVGGDECLADFALVDKRSRVGKIAQKDGDNSKTPEGKVDVVE